MRIEEDIKLDYADVLFRPKRSTLSSRKDVELKRTYKFKYSNHQWSGIPIIAANMDGVGTFKMASELSKLGLFTCLVKHYGPEHWIKNKSLNIHTWNSNLMAISVGTNLECWNIAKGNIKALGLKWICIDIANGYSEHFVDFVRKVRRELPA